MKTTPDDVLFEDYLANRLSAENIVRLKQVLAGDRSARARFVEVLQEWELLSESARQITGISCPVIDDRANRGGPRRRPLLRVAPPPSSARGALRMLVPMSALAATLLLALWIVRPSGEISPLGTIGTATAGVLIQRGEEALNAKAGLALLPGDRIHVEDGAQARIEYPDQSVLTLDQRTDLRLLANSAGVSGKRVELIWGRIDANVVKQPSGRPMVISTPNARAVVLGTMLTLEFSAAAGATRLDVTEGLVGISQNTGRTQVEVPTGHFATVAENTPIVSRPLVAAATPTASNYRPGLRATYFAGTDLKEQIYTRIETGIHSDLGLESVPLGQRRADFSVRWTGYLQPVFSERYQLTLRADAGVRLYIDEKLVIDAWGGGRTSNQYGFVMLDAGKRHALRAEYKQPDSGMTVKLAWKSANQQSEIIPVERLSTDR